LEVSWLYQQRDPCHVALYDIDSRAEGDSKLKIRIGLLDTIRSDYQPHLWCLLVARNLGLLLELSPHDNKYRRVGYFEADDDSWTSKWPFFDYYDCMKAGTLLKL